MVPKRFRNSCEINVGHKKAFSLHFETFCHFFGLADLPILCAHAVFPKLFRIFAFFASDLFRDQRTCHKRSEITAKPWLKSSSKTKGFQLRFFSVLASISKGLGGQVGAPRALWGPSWPFFGVFKSSSFLTICPRWAPRGLLGRSGAILGRIWEGSGRNLVAFGICQ